MSSSENISTPKTELCGCIVKSSKNAFMNVEEHDSSFVDAGSDGCENSCVIDNYSHVSPNIMYVECNVPGRGCDQSEFEAQYAEGCDCFDGNCASEDDCPCLARYGKNYLDFQLLPGKYSGPIVECNSECRCAVDGKCTNSLVQRGPRQGLEIFSTSNGKGLGLRTTSKIPRGGFICEYAGEVIDMLEARRRVLRNVPGEMNYIFMLKEHLSDGTVLKTCVDPTSIGNIGRYINHSCQPNAAIVPVRVDCLVPKLSIFALTDIEAGEEVTFDYGGGEKDCTPPSVVPVGRTPCFCLAENCRKFLPFDPALL